MEELKNQSVIENKNLKIIIDSKGTIVNYGSITINNGDFITIEGANGIGKSTFLNLLNRDGNYYSIEGDVLIDNISIFDYDVYELRRSVVANINQNDVFIRGESTYHALIRPAINAIADRNNIKEKKKEIKELAFNYYRKYLYSFFYPHEKNSAKKKRLLNNPKADLKFMYFQPVSTLSGGQQKMIHILQGVLKAKTIGCRLLLLDEPLNNLDKDNKKVLIELINDLRDNNKDMAILLITHCKVFPGVNTVLKISDGENENCAELIRLDEYLKPFDCLS